MKVGTAKRFLRFVDLEALEKEDDVEKYLIRIAMNDSKALDSILLEVGMDKNTISFDGIVKWLQVEIIEVVSYLHSITEGLQKSDTEGVSNVKNTHLDTLRSLIVGWCERFHQMPPNVENLELSVFCECSHDIFLADERQKYIQENSTTIADGKARVPVY